MSNKPWWGAGEANARNENEDNTVVDSVRPKRNRLAILGSIGLISVLTTGLIVGTFSKPNPYGERASQFESVMYPATVEGVITECGGIFTYNPDSKNYGQFPEGFFEKENGEWVEREYKKQPMIVPAYGYMSREAPDNFPKMFPPESLKTLKYEDTLRLMWDGWMVIWYVNDIDEPTLNSIENYVNTHDKVIAMPWNGEVALPEQRKIAFSMWSVTQSCGLWNTAMADAFVEKEREVRNPRPTTPPDAPLDNNGELYPIDPEMCPPGERETRRGCRTL